MVNKNLVGRCGLYCGNCSVYRAFKDSKELQKIVAKKNDCLPEEVKCNGCQTASLDGWSQEKEWGKNCKILKCINSRKLKFCYECTEYDTCKIFDEFAKMNLKIGMDIRENLQMIKNGKIEEWLLEQDKKWRCPSCGNHIAVSSYLRNCHWCGHKLKQMSANFHEICETTKTQ